MKCELCGAPIEKGKCIYCGKEYSFSCDTKELPEDTIRRLKIIFGENFFRDGEDVYRYCETNNLGKHTPKSSAFSRFDTCLSNLDPDEFVLFPFLGFHNYKSLSDNDGVAAYLVTNKRIMFAYKKTFSSIFSFIPWENIYAIDKENKFLTRTIKISSTKFFLRIEIMDGKIGDAIFEKLSIVYKVLELSNKYKDKSSYIPTMNN